MSTVVCHLYCWPKLAKSVKSLVKSCDTCQHSKGDAPRPNPLQALPLPKRTWEDLSMDFLTGLPPSVNGNNVILTFVDRLTKYAHFVPTSTSVTAAGTADFFMRNVYRLHRLSRTILCDRNPGLTAESFREVFKRLTSGFHPPSMQRQTGRQREFTGQVDRFFVLW